jgi:hypothetical protein
LVVTTNLLLNLSSFFGLQLNIKFPVRFFKNAVSGNNLTVKYLLKKVSNMEAESSFIFFSVDNEVFSKIDLKNALFYSNKEIKTNLIAENLLD